MPIARLPEHLEPKNQIDQLRPGEGGWVVPWAMRVDSERRCLLVHNQRVAQHPGGTVCMRVELRADGFHVWPPPDWTWEVGTMGDTVGMPVAVLHEPEPGR